MIGEEKVIDALLKASPLAGSLLILGISALILVVKYLNKKDAARELAFKEQLTTEGNLYKDQLQKDRDFYKDQSDKKDKFYTEASDKKDAQYRLHIEKMDKLVEIKDKELKELNLTIIAITRENMLINNSLKLVIEKALIRGQYKKDDE